MTDQTEAKILNLESLAATVGKEKEFGSIPLEAMVFLTSQPKISGSELKYFIEGFFFGHNLKVFIPPTDIGE